MFPPELVDRVVAAGIVATAATVAGAGGGVLRVGVGVVQPSDEEVIRMLVDGLPGGGCALAVEGADWWRAGRALWSVGGLASRWRAVLTGGGRLATPATAGAFYRDLRLVYRWHALDGDSAGERGAVRPAAGVWARAGGGRVLSCGSSAGEVRHARDQTIFGARAVHDWRAGAGRRAVEGAGFGYSPRGLQLHSFLSAFQKAQTAVQLLMGVSEERRKGLKGIELCPRNLIAGPPIRTMKLLSARSEADPRTSGDRAASALIRQKCLGNRLQGEMSQRGAVWREDRG